MGILFKMGIRYFFLCLFIVFQSVTCIEMVILNKLVFVVVLVVLVDTPIEVCLMPGLYFVMHQKTQNRSRVINKQKGKKDRLMAGKSTKGLE